MSLVDPHYELIDPNPDLHALFVQYNLQFFDGKLGSCEVSWSNRMTLCAGVCSFHRITGHCSIRLSEPLLKLRPRKDLVETLLHEMIHAFLFLTNRIMDRDGHGPQFQAHMHRINAIAGTQISIYHSFHAEVAVYHQHWWRCDGRCRSMQPFYGFVKRAMNRAPSKNDFWWNRHQQMCGGSFIKVKSPEGKVKETKSRKVSQKNNTGTPKIDSVFKKEVKPQSDMVIEGGVLMKKVVKGKKRSPSFSKRVKGSPKKAKKETDLPKTGGTKLGGDNQSGISRLLDLIALSTSLTASINSPKTTPTPIPKENPPLIKLEKDDFSWDDNDIVVIEEALHSMSTSTNVQMNDKQSSLNQFTTDDSQPCCSSNIKPITSTNSSNVNDVATVDLPKPLPRLRMEIVPDNDGIEIISEKIVPRRPEIEIIDVKIRNKSSNFFDLINCPVCNERVSLTQINSHLDNCAT